MKVGDYVRTKNQGIKRIDKIFENATINKYGYEDKKNDYEYFIIRTDEIIKSSPNIIDLIEVGDYVDGYPVARIYKSTNKDIGRVIEYETDNVGGYEYEAEDLWESHIKSISIVTKEQFKSMEFKYDR